MNTYAAYHGMWGGMDPSGKATTYHYSPSSRMVRAYWHKIDEEWEYTELVPCEKIDDALYNTSVGIATQLFSKSIRVTAALTLAADLCCDCYVQYAYRTASYSEWYGTETISWSWARMAYKREYSGAMTLGPSHEVIWTAMWRFVYVCLGKETIKEDWQKVQGLYRPNAKSFRKEYGPNPAIEIYSGGLGDHNSIG